MTTIPWEQVRDELDAKHGITAEDQAFADEITRAYVAGYRLAEEDQARDREGSAMTIPWDEVRERLGITPEREEYGRRITEAYVTGYRLAELRKKAQVTQVELARRMGIGQPRVSAIERGDIETLTVASVRSYVEALGGTVLLVASFGDTDIRLQVPESAA
jgi:DNA-binding XRE family transcriptional regulator